MTWIKDEIEAWVVDEDEQVMYWILADSEAKALRFWLDAVDMMDGVEMQGEDFVVKLRAPSEEELSKASFRGERDEPITMLEEMERDPTARMVACSEW